MDAARFYAVGRGFVPSADWPAPAGHFQGEQLGAGSRELYVGSGFVTLEPAPCDRKIPARLVWWKGAGPPSKDSFALLSAATEAGDLGDSVTLSRVQQTPPSTRFALCLR
jgi:hypothetical protein